MVACTVKTKQTAATIKSRMVQSGKRSAAGACRITEIIVTVAAASSAAATSDSAQKALGDRVTSPESGRKFLLGEADRGAAEAGRGAAPKGSGSNSTEKSSEPTWGEVERGAAPGSVAISGRFEGLLGVLNWSVHGRLR